MERGEYKRKEKQNCRGVESLICHWTSYRQKFRVATTSRCANFWEIIRPSYPQSDGMVKRMFRMIGRHLAKTISLGITETKKKSQGMTELTDVYRIYWFGVEVRNKVDKWVGMIMKPSIIKNIIIKNNMSERILVMDSKLDDIDMWKLIVEITNGIGCGHINYHTYMNGRVQEENKGAKEPKIQTKIEKLKDIWEDTGRKLNMPTKKG